MEATAAPKFITMPSDKQILNRHHATPIVVKGAPPAIVRERILLWELPEKGKPVRFLAEIYDESEIAQSITSPYGASAKEAEICDNLAEALEVIAEWVSRVDLEGFAKGEQPKGHQIANARRRAQAYVRALSRS